jgi:hypothetical protein
VVNWLAAILAAMSPHRLRPLIVVRTRFQLLLAGDVSSSLIGAAL